MPKNRIALACALPLLALTVGSAPSTPRRADVAPEGGRNYFFCAAFQLIKYGGMVTARPDAVLVGAVGSGLACAFGW